MKLLWNIKRIFVNDMSTDMRLKVYGHRSFIGGNDAESWYGIGKLQYHFLIMQGLKPSHNFLDIACGSLRLGQFLIPYLETGRYYGIDAEKNLISAGVEKELPKALIDEKQPHFTANMNFDFSFIDYFDYAMAQSLFTHLTMEDIAICFKNLLPKAHKDSRFYFSYFEGHPSRNKHNKSDAHKNWWYTFEDLAACADQCGWEAHLIGDWNHPRGIPVAFVTPKK